MGPLVLAFLAAGFTQNVPLIPRSVLFSDPVLTDVQMSPDGRRVAYISTMSGGRSLKIHGLDREPLPGVQVIRYTWLQDSKTILVAGAKGQQTVLLELGIDGGVKDIPLPGQAQIQYLSTSSRLPDQFAVGLSSSESARNGLFKVTNSGETWEKLDDNQGFSRWFLDANLNPIAGQLTGPESVNLFYRDKAGAWKELASYGQIQPPMAGISGVSADGERIFYVGNEDSDTSVLREFNRGNAIRKILMQDPQVDLIAQSVFCSPKTFEPLWGFGYFPRARRGVLRPDLSEHFVKMSEQQAGDVSVVGMSNDEKRWLVRFLNGTPITYFIYDTESGKLESLFSDMPQLEPYKLAQRKGFQISSRDGLKLPIDVYLPPGSDQDKDGIPDKPLPTLVFVHGGPWIGFDWNFWLQARHHQLLANRGYAVIKAEFRGAAGYGKRFMDLGDLEWGGKMNNDLVDIARWSVENKIADKDKMGIWGGSYGGYATMAALTFSPDVFTCGVAVYGLYDLLPTDPSSLGFDPFWRRRVGDPTTPEGKRLLRERSPINFAKNVSAPVLLCHGTLDDRVPPTQSKRMAEELQKQGKQVSYVTYSDGHDFMKPGTWEQFWSFAEGFLQRHLGGRAEPGVMRRAAEAKGQ